MVTVRNSKEKAGRRDKVKSCYLLSEGAPAKSIGCTADDGADGVPIALEISLDCLLTETVEIVVVDSSISLFDHLDCVVTSLKFNYNSNLPPSV